MKASRICFVAPNQLELQDFDFEAANLGPREIALRTVASLISPGTELACLSGIEGWARMPFVPGYAACGEVIAAGPNAGVAPGNTVFAYTAHASHARTDRLWAPLPAGLDPTLAVFARMAAVAITSLRVSAAELGDTVAVTGLGLVGNFAAQLFGLAGCEVIGIDPSPRRRALARECGVAHAIDAADSAQAVADLTGGRMCACVVEASGAPAVAESAVKLAGKLGEMILVGSPRGEHQTNLTPFLNAVHLWGNCVTLKGAHEWRYPVAPDPQGQAKHSIGRNVEILLRLIADGRLKVQPLLTHVVSPYAAAAEAYAGLREKKDEYLGVVFDWTAGC